MRLASLLLTFSASLSGGCAAMIAASGKDMTVLKTRAEVHAQLGEPIAAGVKEGEPYEEFRTRKKIAECVQLKYGEGYAMALAITLGTVELILVPQELYHLAKRTLGGQTICVTYDGDGQVTGQYLDGMPLSFFGFRKRPTKSDEQDRPAASQAQ